LAALLKEFLIKKFDIGISEINFPKIRCGMYFYRIFGNDILKSGRFFIK
jgi:hypothetical protein